MNKILLILTTLFLIQCNIKKEVSNELFFINCTEEIPLINLELDNDFENSRELIETTFGESLCERCSWVNFKVPFKYKSHNINLKLMSDFDTPYCKDCGIPMRYRFYYYISINKFNEIFAEDEIVNIETLQSTLIKFFMNIGENEAIAPEKFNQVNFLLEWEKKTPLIIINKTINQIITARLNFVKEQLRSNDIDFEKLDTIELKELDKKYPLRIELDLGKRDSI